MTADTPATPARSGRPRVWRILWWTLGTIAGLLIAAVVGVLVWSQLGVMAAEPDPLASVQADPAITITDHPEGIVLAPSTGASTFGLVYIPGAKVDPWAYAAKMSGVVAADDVTVVITKPWLNLAFFDLRPLSTFTALAPKVGTWMVGGHSLGGVKACQLATDAKALVLFGSYCANDLSSSGIPVLSIAGSEDGLSTPQNFADARHLLPSDAQLVEIRGAGHASFGNYGPQPGDGIPTISDSAMTTRLTELVGQVHLSGVSDS